MSGPRGLAALLFVLILPGCHISKRLHPDCHQPQDYQRAISLPPLKVPSGMDSPNTQGALVIPTVELTAPPPGPKDPCLDLPPKYQPAPAARPASH